MAESDAGVRPLVADRRRSGGTPQGPVVDQRALEYQREQHPAWRLLAASDAPFVIAFLYHVFIVPNARGVGFNDLRARLEEALRVARMTGNGPVRSAAEYLELWTDEQHRWLRKYPPPGSDEFCFDLMPHSEAAIRWVVGLTERRTTVSTESKLLTVVDLLRQLDHGIEANPEVRLQELERQRDAIEAEIKDVRAGRVQPLDPAIVQDRFSQLQEAALAVMSDFRILEQSFRDLDRSIRSQVTTWDGPKGQLLSSIFGEKDHIRSSAQGRSFQAFWEFLMQPALQDELAIRLERVTAHPAVKALAPDPRFARIYRDWVTAGEVTQREGVRISAQLRRFLDSRDSVEIRRITQVIRRIEQHAVAMADGPMPEDDFMEMAETSPAIRLPLERPLYRPRFQAVFDDTVATLGDGDAPLDALLGLVHVDVERLKSNVAAVLGPRSQVSLAEVVAAHPLEQGLAELLTYLSLATETGGLIVRDGIREQVKWVAAGGVERTCEIPQVLFLRGGTGGVRAD